MLIDVERTGSHLHGIVADDDDVAIAAVTVAELLTGVHLASDERRDQRQAFVDELCRIVPVEDYDIDVARHHADLLVHTRRSGEPRGAHDLIIAATAMARDRIVVSDDLRFDGLPGLKRRRTR